MVVAPSSGGRGEWNSVSREIKAAIIAGVALLAVAAVPASAQRNRRQWSMAQTWAPATMRNFAKCVFDRSPRAAANLLAMEPGDRNFPDAMRRFAQGHEDCAPMSRLTLSGIYFIGGVAEASVNYRIRGDHLSRYVALDPARPAIRARDETEMMTLCTVRRAPEELAALFATEPMSEAEAGAMRTLGPVIGGCLTNGQTLRLDRAALRAMLALSAYRLMAWNEAPLTTAAAAH
jgi:hypothetical protein